MEWRNPKWTRDGRIDVEVNHPEFGWVPYTADANDPEDILLRAGGASPLAAVIEASGQPIAAADPEPTSPPPGLEPWRFEAQMALEGLTATVDAVIDGMPEPARTIAKAKRTRSNRYHRDDPLFVQLAPAVWPEAEDPSAELDAVWLAASQL